MSSDHKVAKQGDPRYQKGGSTGVTLTCTCGRQFTGTSRPNSKSQTNDDVERKALRNAEAEFRKHIPIR